MSSTLKALIRLMRPHQWPKNAFVLAGAFFTHTWDEAATLQRVLVATLAFCLASSLVYLLNDWVDREADARHPTKCRRPLASGQVSAKGALGLGLALAASLLACVVGQPVLALLIGLYLLINIAYSFKLKHVAVIDVCLISAGFMLRLLAGTVAVGIPPSRWLLVTGLFVTLFLGFSKRRAEASHDAASQRRVMKQYSLPLLDTYVAMAMTATLVTYGLYATSPETQALHGERLVYSLPLVVFGMLRFTQRVHGGQGEDAASDIARDPWLIAALLGWAAVFVIGR